MPTEEDSPGLSPAHLIYPVGMAEEQWRQMEDAPSVHSYLLGGSIGLAAGCVIVFNSIVSYTLIRNAFLKGLSGSLYKLSLNLITFQTLHIVMNFFYLAPASMLQTWMLPERLRFAPGVFSVLGWKGTMISLCALAVNRYIALRMPDRYDITFSPRRTKVIIGVVWLLVIVLTLATELVIPCCAFYPYYKTYSFVYASHVDFKFNYSNVFVNIPLNAFTTIFTILIYSLVLLKIRDNNKIMDQFVRYSIRKRRRREAWYAVQLAIVNAIFVAVWVSFQLLAHVLPLDAATRGIFSIVTFIDILHAATESSVLMCMSKEVRRAVRRLFQRRSNAPPSSSTMVAPESTAGGMSMSEYQTTAGPIFFTDAMGVSTNRLG